MLTDPSPPTLAASTRPATRSGWRMARSSATPPPQEWPTTIASATPRDSSSSTTASAFGAKPGRRSPRPPIPEPVGHEQTEVVGERGDHVVPVVAPAGLAVQHDDRPTRAVLVGDEAGAATPPVVAHPLRRLPTRWRGHRPP